MDRTKKTFLIGRGIKDKFLKEIYEYMFPDTNVFVKNLKTNKLFDDFLEERDFFFIIVCEPFKSKIVDYLDKTSPTVKRTGACNFVLNKGGILVGYNTEVESIKKTLSNHGIDVFSKKVAICGKNGKGNESLFYAIKEIGANVSYTVSLENADEIETLFSFGAHQTESGAKAFDLASYKNLKTYIELGSQDFRTREMSICKEKGIGVIGGIDFLIETAKLNRFCFARSLVPSKIVKMMKEDILSRHVNLVVVSLPTIEKEEMMKDFRKILNEPKESTTGSFISTDLLIEKVTHKKIKRILEEKYGDELYKSLDASIAREIEFTEGRVVFVGHETILNDDNYYRLAKNGLLIYLKKTDFSDFKEDKKSFVKSQETLKRMYKANNPIYERRSDLTMMKAKDALDIVKNACEILSNE